MGSIYVNVNTVIRYSCLGSASHVGKYFQNCSDFKDCLKYIHILGLSVAFSVDTGLFCDVNIHA